MNAVTMSDSMAAAGTDKEELETATRTVSLSEPEQDNQPIDQSAVSGTTSFETASVQPTAVPCYFDFSKSPFNFAHDTQSYEPSDGSSKLSEDSFPKRAAFSPSGMHYLVSSEDKALRMYQIPYHSFDNSHKPATPDEESPLWKINEGETIHSFDWYPCTDPSQAESLVFATSIRDHPLHLWDGNRQKVIAQYRGHDHSDEVASPIFCRFNVLGDKLFGCYDREIKIFDVNRPGFPIDERKTTPSRRSKEGQKGIISTLSFNPDMSRIYACGSFSGSVFVYSEDEGEMLLGFDTFNKGVTQVQFSPCGNLLYAAARRTNMIYGWDIRNSQQILHKFSRQAFTNQRIGFDIDPSGTFLGTGSQNGKFYVYNVKTEELEVDNAAFQGAAEDSVNSFSFHPNGIVFMLTCGERRFDNLVDMDSDSGEDKENGGNRTRKRGCALYRTSYVYREIAPKMAKER